MFCILYYDLPKIGSCDLTTKIEFMIIGLTTSCEIIQIEITKSRKYMKKPSILSMVGFSVYLICILQNGYFCILLKSWVSDYVTTWLKKLTKIFQIILTTYSKISQIKAMKWGCTMSWYELFSINVFDQFILHVYFEIVPWSIIY